MEFVVEIRGDSRVLFVAGHLDESGAEKLQAAVEPWSDRIIGSGQKKVTLDFSAVTFIDSTILRLLLTIAKRIGKRGASLVLTNLSPEVSSTLRVSGFQRLLEVSGKIILQEEVALELPPPEPGETDSLEVFLGDKIIRARPGDSLGSEGSICPEVFEGIPGVERQAVTFYQQNEGWILKVADQLTTQVILDGIILFPGQIAPLIGLRFLQISLLRLRIRGTRANTELNQDESQVQTQVENVFSKTAEWLGKAVSE